MTTKVDMTHIFKCQLPYISAFKAHLKILLKIKLLVCYIVIEKFSQIPQHRVGNHLVIVKFVL
jgi:hypothetical protein